MCKISLIAKGTKKRRVVKCAVFTLFGVPLLVCSSANVPGSPTTAHAIGELVRKASVTSIAVIKKASFPATI